MACTDATHSNRPMPQRHTDVAAEDIGRNMLDDDRFREAVAGFDFRDHRVCIVGGGGFVGLHVARLFCECGQPPLSILLFDRVVAATAVDATIPARLQRRGGIRCSSGDVTDAAAVEAAVAGATVVVHVASYGMSGREMLDVPRIRAVNLGGTRHVLTAATAAGSSVRAVVYTSSYNAVFSGRPFRDATDLPYPPPSAFSDEYSRTKSAAEQLVLAANGAGAHGVKTVALRMAGIYGVGEQRHFPRIIRLVRSGLVRTTIGGLEARQDWVSVANSAYAHVLAAARLLASDASAVAGRAFPVSEHAPVNQYRMLQPLFEALGHPLPRVDLPVRVALAAAWAMEAVLALLAPVVALPPLLTRGEVLKVSVEHYFAPAASVAGLGYRPVVPFAEGIARTIAAFVADERQRDAERARRPDRSLALLRLAPCCALAVVVAFAWFVLL